MRLFTHVLVLVLLFIEANAQSNRILKRRIDHLEKRYELETSRTSEEFRELWELIDQKEAKCCRSVPITFANETTTNIEEEIDDKMLKDKISVIRNAFKDEKKTVRVWFDSVEKMVTEYNHTCSVKIEQIMNKMEENVKDGCTCSTKWVKIYENGPNGEEIFGERSDLIQAVLTGSSVKLLADKRYITSVQNLKIVKGHVTAQALFHVSMSNRKFQDNAYWWFVLASTTGHWYMSRYNIGEHVSRGDNEIKYGMEWFIRRPCDINPAARILSDGTVAYGTKKNVITAVRNGFPVRITSLETGYTFLADNLEVSDDEVAAQALWHLSQQSSSDYSRFIFQKNAYWYFTIWATTGFKQMSRWNVGKHQSRGKTSSTSLTDWFVDPCWKMAYRHGPSGGYIEGNKNVLIESIRRGHRARIVYKDFSFEPNVLFISEGEVYGLSMDSVSKDSFDEFEASASWLWRSTSTDGTLQILKTPVGSSDNFITNESVQMAWFVDTRDWKEMVSITASGEVSGGSKDDLVSFARQGADIRYGMKHTGGRDFVYVQPDNISLFHKESSLLAMHIRQTRFYKVISPSWMFTLTNTEGLRDTSTWMLGNHKKISREDEHVQTIWFVSE